MAQAFKVALLQNCAGADMDANIAQCSELARQAHDQGADLICLPEMFSCLYSSDGSLDVGPHPAQTHPALQHFSELAAELGTWIQPGSIAVEMPTKFDGWARPGASGDPRAAWMDMARTICRRAELSAWGLGDGVSLDACRF